MKLPRIGFIPVLNYIFIRLEHNTKTAEIYLHEVNLLV